MTAQGQKRWSSLILQTDASRGKAEKPPPADLGDRVRHAAPTHGPHLKKACVMDAGTYTKAEVATELGVSRHTLWRELARGAE